MANKKGGKGYKKGKKGSQNTTKDLIFKVEGQEYAVVLKLLGNCRLEAQCYDGVKRLCHIRGAMRKKVWINMGDTILVSLRDFQDNKADVINKYSPEDVRKLQEYGEFKEMIKTEDGVVKDNEDECVFDFEDI